MKICVINTGGTISSIGTPLAPMSAQRFAQAATELLRPAFAARFPRIDLHFETKMRFSSSAAGSIDSTDLQPSDWCVMAQTVLDHYAQFDAFIILHGTDSLEFTGAALPFLLNVFDPPGFGAAVLSKPVILTGAQTPLFSGTTGGMVLNAGSDAFANLAGAIACSMLRLPEVAICFDGKLFRANRAVKQSTARFAGFTAPHLPPLAEFGLGIWHGHASPLPGPARPDLAIDNSQAFEKLRDQLETVAQWIDQFPVIELNAFPTGQGAQNLLARSVNDAVANGCKGLILHSYGEGNFPSGDPASPSQGPVTQALIAAHAAGVLIVNATRALEGQVGDLHYNAGAWMKDTGAVGSADMTAAACFAKAMIFGAITVAGGLSRAELNQMMQFNLAGECYSRDRLHSFDRPRLLPRQSLTAVAGALRLVNEPESGVSLLNGDGDEIWSPCPGQPGVLRLAEHGGLTLTGFDGRVHYQFDPDQPVQGGACLLVRYDAEGTPALEIRSACGQLLSRLV